MIEALRDALALMATTEALARLALLYGLGLAAWPLSARLLGRGMPLAAWAAARVLGPGLLAWGCWWAACLGLRWGPGLFWAGAALLAGAGGWLARRGRPRLPGRGGWLAGELLFLAAFALVLLLRLHSEGIRHNEKPMDAAFLTACYYEDQMPPRDPWRWEGTIPYYYGGYAEAALLARMGGASPERGYDLGLASCYALAALLLFALARELGRNTPLALTATAAALLAGNGSLLAQLARHWREGAVGGFRLDVWQASRVIRDGPGGEFATINEFPFFSFLHGDLHPHLMGLPALLLFLALGLALLRRRGAAWGLMAALAWALGRLAWINGFDFLTGLGLAAGLTWLWSARRGRGPVVRLGRAGLLWLGLAGLGWLALLPFHLHYDPPLRGGEGWAAWWPLGLTRHRSGLLEFLTVWALPLLPAVLGLAAARGGAYARALPDWARAWRWGALAGLVFVLYVLTGGWVAGALGAGLLLVLGGGASPARRFERLCLAGALALLLFAEVAYVRDAYGPGLQRMNTVFKLHYPCWLLLALPLPLWLRRLWRVGDGPGVAWQRGGLALWAGLFAVALAFAPLATVQRLRAAPGRDAGDWDGLAWMRTEAPGDRAAIAWLREHAEPGAVLLEAPGRAYGPEARLATHSPARALIGWAGHEALWRGAGQESLREAAGALYESNQAAARLSACKQYGIEYIYEGVIERERYGPLDPAGLRQVWQAPEGSARLYRPAREASGNGARTP